MRNIIFCGGVHGSGKGTVCKALSSKYGYLHLVASELIGWNDQKNKLVPNVQAEQEILKNNIKNLDESKKYILDGHFCLINSQEQIERIPISTFEAISPMAIIVISENIDLIIKHLYERDGIIYSNDFFVKFQNEEMSYAEEVANRLGISCSICNANNFEKYFQEAL